MYSDLGRIKIYENNNLTKPIIAVVVMLHKQKEKRLLKDHHG